MSTSTTHLLVLLMATALTVGCAIEGSELGEEDDCDNCESVDLERQSINLGKCLLARDSPNELECIYDIGDSQSVEASIVVDPDLPEVSTEPRQLPYKSEPWVRPVLVAELRRENWKFGTEFEIKWSGESRERNWSHNGLVGGAPFTETLRVTEAMLSDDKLTDSATEQWLFLIGEPPWKQEEDPQVQYLVPSFNQFPVRFSHTGSAPLRRVNISFETEVTGKASTVTYWSTGKHKTFTRYVPLDKVLSNITVRVKGYEGVVQVTEPGATILLESPKLKGDPGTIRLAKSKGSGY